MSWFDPWDEIEAVALCDDPVERALARAAPAVRALLDARPRRPASSRRPTARRCSASTGDDLRRAGRARPTPSAPPTSATRSPTSSTATSTSPTSASSDCQFCAFKRQRWEADAYTHGRSTSCSARSHDAVARGATEVCMQGGINPDMPPFTYRDLLVAIKTRLPGRCTCTPSRRWRSCTARAAPAWTTRSTSAMLRDARPRHRSPAPPPRSSTTRCARSCQPQEGRRPRPGSRSSPPRIALGMPTHVDRHVRPRRDARPRRPRTST